ncbi:class I adenylate-forming enzyme family protein [Xanthobacter sediminis]
MITDLLARNATARPQRTFAVTDHGSYSFADIHGAALRYAQRLRLAGVREGDHVSLIAGNHAGYLVAWFAINMAGAVAVTLNTQLTGEGLQYALTQSDSRLVVVDAAWLAGRGMAQEHTAWGLPLMVLGSEQEIFAQSIHWEPAEPARLKPSAPATIMYTSGTTGLPKGVLNSHAAYLAAGRGMVNVLGLSHDDRCMVVLPLFHANPQMYAVMSALEVGSSLALREKFSATSFFDDAKRLGATGFTYVGTILSILAARHAGEKSDHALRFCMGGGAPLKVWREVEERFKVKVHELYGMTEIGGWICANSLHDTRIGSCGPIRPDMDVRIFDEDDRELPPGEQGEIVVRPRVPDVILSGYYKQPDKMAEACRNLWFHTGDRGHIDSDGYLYFHSRIKELIRRGGEMVSPVELETMLRKMPGIVDCAAVGVDDDILGQEIKMVVVAEPATPSTAHAILDYLSSRVPGFMLPRYVEFLDAIPKTETEKIQRHKIAYLDQRAHDVKARLAG